MNLRPVTLREPKPKRDLRNPLAKARDKWFASDEGERMADTLMLCERNHAEYLKNRLEVAFIAGYEAGQKAKQ